MKPIERRCLDLDTELVRVEEAMRQLGGISRWTLYNLIRSGELASVTIGRRRFIPAAAIRAYVAQLTEDAA